MEHDLEQLSHIHLERRRHELLFQLGKIEEELQRRRQQGRLITRKDEVEWVSSGELHGSKHVARIARLVTPELGFNVHTFRAFLSEIAPGAQEGTYHRHGEAIKYYLSGKGEEIIGEQRFSVGPGDAVFIQANTWHGTQNTGDEPLRFLAVAQFPGTYLQVPAPFRIREDLRLTTS